MRSCSRWRVAWAVPFSLAGCTLLVDTDGLSGAAPALEPCTTDCDADRPSVSVKDGSDVEVQADTGVCGLPTNDTFDVLDPKWVLRGRATRTQGIQLTPELDAQVGQLHWNQLLEFARFEVTIKFTITTTEEWAADGMAFAWLEGPQMPPLGGGSDSYGIAGVGAKGYAIVIDTFPNTPSQQVDSVPDVSVRSLSAFATRIAKSGQIPKLSDEKEHALRISLSAGVVTARIDGTIVTTATLPSYVPFKGYLSISAGTGGFKSKHVVNSVDVRVGTTGPCGVVP